ncbi:MAG: FKBP-type peptidyl-prolyl cis-trans isomerase [Opitutaceae bacterium]
MKPTLPVLAALLAVASPLGAQNLKINIDPAKPAEPAPAAQPAAPQAQPAAQPERKLIQPVDGKYSDEQKMEVYGFIIARKLGMLEQITPLLKSEEEVIAFLRGFGAAMTRVELPYDGNIIVPQTQEMIKTRTEEVNALIQKALAEAKEKNGKDAATFLATVDSKPGVKKTSSGLRYEILQEGKGAKAKSGQAAWANYEAKFIDGTVFDRTDVKNGPREFVIDSAIPGLKEGLQLTGVGGKVKLYVPSELGFGDSGQVLAPGVLTIFEMEIVDVKEPTKKPEEKK